MYVCMCRGVTDQEIREKRKQSGNCSTVELLKQLGVAHDCGACILQAQEICQEEGHSQSKI